MLTAIPGRELPCKPEICTTTVICSAPQKGLVGILWVGDITRGLARLIGDLFELVHRGLEPETDRRP